MRTEISTLLREAGVGPHDGPSWERLVVMHSSGSLINPTWKVDDHLSERGFHFLVLSPSGVPTHYCKCSPALPNGRPHRQVEVLAMLAADPDARAYVSHGTTSVRNGRIEIFVAPYFQGRPLDRVLTEEPAERRWKLVERTLDVVACLSNAFARAKTAAGEAPAPVYPDRSIAQVMEDLDQMGVACALLAELHEELRAAGAMRGVPQHGDFWAANILCSDEGKLCVIDLNHVGTVAVPLYDVLHCLRTLADGRPFRGTRLWTERVLGGDDVGRESRRILAHERERWSLDPAQVGACFVFFVLMAAVRTRRRGGAEEYWGRFRDEIPATAAVLDDVGSLEALGAALLQP